MNLLSKLLPYVRSGTTEGDARFLPDVFVSTDQLADFCSIEPGSMRVLVGNKGTGKTAVAEWIDRVATRRQIPCLLLRPDDFTRTDAPTSLDMSALKSYYFDILLRAVSSQIGAKFNSKTPLKGNAGRLYNEARAKGLAREDFITKTLDLLSALSVPAGSVNGTQLARDLAGTNSLPKLVEAVNSQLLPSTSKLFYLLIDDTDQVSKPNEPEQLNKIWAVILAARKLSMQCPSVRPIVTLRSSVWARLIHEDSAQRDQFDHIRPLVVHLKTADEHIQEIVRRRLERASRDAFVQAHEPYANFFEGDTVLLPGSRERRLWKDFLSKSARERPRDALQLIKSSIDSANLAHHSKIGDDDAGKAMLSYSSERVDDVVAEYSLDCNAIRRVIDTFANVPHELSFETLREHLASVPSTASIVLRGLVLKPNDNADFVSLLGLLHEIGFVNARLPDAAAPRRFKHINYSDEPTFVRLANWNRIQAASWEIHPAFRSHLQAVKEALDRERRA